MSEQPSKWKRLKELLDDQSEWPTIFVFKLIVPRTSLDALKALVGSDLEIRPSRGGKYLGVTLKRLVDSSDAVIEVYESVSRIDGLIAL
jgi:putative lipoic acid-binding regulatory protein